MKPKLLLISSDTSHTYNFYKLIEDYFSEIKVVSNKKNKDWNFPVEELDFSLKNIANHFNTPRKIRKIAEEFKPDIIHIHQANSFAYFSLKGLKNYPAPKILTAWGSDILVSPRASFLLRRMVKYNLKHADVFTSDSKFMAEEMQKLSGAGKLDILIVNFGIGIQPVNTEKQNIIYSNRLHKKLYRVDSVIRAFDKFIKTPEGSNWNLIIAATGEETGNLKKLSDGLNLNYRVQFAGWVDKIKNAEFYSKARIFVSIPESDATAISLLEAMACGCLPVVSDLPANREWINDQVNGLIVKDIQENFFSEALQINANKAADINAEIIKEHGTKEINKSKFVSLYEKLLRKTG